FADEGKSDKILECTGFPLGQAVREEHSRTPTGTIKFLWGLGSGGANNSAAYWTTEDMGSFSLPPLADLDPLPSLFPFSPCSANYNFSISP
ncbi:hypothetical protein L9F63_023047, partial [Diploptera punctata]